MKQSKLFFLIIFSSFLLLFYGCAQLFQMARLADCEYSLHSITDAKVAGVNIQGINTFTDFNFIDAGKITIAYATNKLPLDFNLNLEITNPNKNKAALNKLGWIAQIDDRDVAKGIVEKNIEILPGESSILPIHISLNLKEIFNSESVASLYKIIKNLVGLSNDSPTKIKLKIKPSIKIGDQMIDSPTYFNVKYKY